MTNLRTICRIIICLNVWTAQSEVGKMNIGSCKFLQICWHAKTKEV